MTRLNWDDYTDSVADNDRNEHRAAAIHDKRDLVRIGGLRYEADRVPSERDLEGLE